MLTRAKKIVILVIIAIAFFFAFCCILQYRHDAEVAAVRHRDRLAKAHEEKLRQIIAEDRRFFNIDFSGWFSGQLNVSGFVESEAICRLSTP